MVNVPYAQTSTLKVDADVFSQIWSSHDINTLRSQAAEILVSERLRILLWAIAARYELAIKDQALASLY